jgi:hypothetical protein
VTGHHRRGTLLKHFPQPVSLARSKHFSTETVHWETRERDASLPWSCHILFLTGSFKQLHNYAAGPNTSVFNLFNFSTKMIDEGFIFNIRQLFSAERRPNFNLAIVRTPGICQVLILVIAPWSMLGPSRAWVCRPTNTFLNK